MAQSPEAHAFLTRLSQINLDNPDSTLESALRPAQDDEAVLRRLFATERNTNPRLKDPHVGLVSVYGQHTDHIKKSHPRVVKPSPPSDTIDDSPSVYVDSNLDRHHIMPLTDDTRRKHGEPCIAQTLEEFQNRWSIFTEGSLSQLTDWSNVIAAGGSVLACLLPLPAHVVAKGSKRAIRKYYHSEGYPASDVDLFLYGLTPEQAEVKANLIFESIRDSVPWEVTAVRTKHAVSIHCQYPYRPVQIILRLYASPAEILAGFDVDSSCVAYDGQRVLASPRAIVALMTQCNTVAMDRRSPSYEVRLTKYAARGFEISVPDLHRQDIDPSIFERSITRVQGLGRLLVLERLSTPEQRESFIADRRRMRGRPEVYQSWRRNRLRVTKGDLKAAAIQNLDGIEMNDYEVAFHVPYGPGIDARKVEKLIYQTDLGMNSTFNPKNKDRRLHRHPAFFGTMKEVLADCCEHCPVPKDEEEKELQGKEDEQYIRGPVTFMQEDPGRQSITGSFNPIDSGEWSAQAYVKPITKLFNLIAKHDRRGVQHFIKTNANPENDPLQPTARDFLGRTPLQFAVICGATDIAMDLIDSGARMTLRMVDGKTAFHLACHLSGNKNEADIEGYVGLVKKMLSKSEENRIAKEKQESEEAQKDKERQDSAISEGDAPKAKDDDRVRDSSEDDWSSDPADEDADDEVYKEARKVNPDSEEPDAALTTTVFHTLVAANKIEIIETLLRVDPNAKTACKFLSTPSWRTSIHPVVTAISGDYRAMVALLMGYGNAKMFITQEDFDRSAAANPSREHNQGGHDNWLQRTYQPLEVSLIHRNSIYKMIAKVEPETTKTLVPKETYYYKSSPSYRRSILEWIDYNLRELKKLLRTNSTTVATTTDKEIVSEDALQEAVKAAESSETWVTEAKRLVKIQEGLEQKSKGTTTESDWEKQRRIKEAQKKKNVESHIAYYEEARQFLVAAGAKTWDEIYPDEKSAAVIEENEQVRHQTGPQTEQKKRWRKYVQLATDWYAREVGEYLEEAYDELYEAAWRGDVQKLRELCLPTENSTSSSKPRDLLQIAAAIKIRDISNNNSSGWSPLFVALQARQWDAAKVIFEIANQQHQEEEKKPTFSARRRIVFDSDEEDEDEDSDEGSDYSAETEKVGVDSIAARFNIVHTEVAASSLLTQTFNFPVNGKTDVSVNILTKAIAEQDIEALECIYELMSSLKEPITLGDGDLDTILHYDSAKILDAFIRRTGMGLLFEKAQRSEELDEQKAAEDNDEDAEEENRKIYLGLNVHGKKRKDLVQKVDPDAYNMEEVVTLPLLWRACKVGATECIQYLASSAPIDAYKHYASTANTKLAKRLGAIDDLGSQLPSLLGFAINSLAESPLLAALGFNRDCLRTIKTLMKVAPKLTSSAMNSVVKVQRYTPLLCAVAFGTTVETIDWLLANGASPLARDSRGWNVLHILCNSARESDFDNLKHLLTKLPEDTITTLLSQQSKGDRNTPLSLTVKKGFVDGVAYLLNKYPKSVSASLGLRSADGSIPLHVAALSGFAEIASLLMKAGHQEMLYLENGVGATALEIARLGYFTNLIRGGFPGVSVVPNSMQCWIYTHDLPSHTGLTEKDEGEVKGLRKIVDAIQGSGSLANKPDVLQALLLFAELSEKEVIDAKNRNQDVETVEDDTKVRNRTEVCDRKATFAVFSEAVISVPSRFLVQLHDVQAVVLGAVNKENPYRGRANRNQRDDLDSEPGEEKQEKFLLASPA
ncbi:hypothetical protein FRC02_005883 [Tulasnella sp. 418]|nr:hypothetical protein FRC02_005883 [Tulasnella sp. 418]